MASFSGFGWTEVLRAPRMLAFAPLVLVLGLSACEDSQSFVLPGERENLRDVLGDGDDLSEIAAAQNTSAPLSLPSARANAEWAQPWGTASYRTAHPALSNTPSLQWSVDIGAGNARKQRLNADPVVGGGRIYTLDAAATVSAISTAGSRLWSVDLTPATDQSDEASGGGISYANETVYVTSGFGTLTALEASTGETRWTQSLDASGTGAPTVFGDLVYLTSGDDTGWALDAQTGRIRWQLGTSGSVNNVFGAPSPTVADGFVIFAFGNGDVRAVFRRGGLQRWSSTIVGERRGFALSEVVDITGPPVADRGTVFIGNQSGRTVALNVASGKRVWTAKEGASGPIWPAGNSIFFVTDQNQLVRLSAASGERVWGVQLPNFVKDRPRRRSEVYAHFGPILAGGRVMIASSDGYLRAYSPEDGTLLSEVGIPGGAATGFALANGVLYVVNGNGSLLAYQ